MLDPYPVRPWSRPCRGEVRLPGSKSLTNRALVLAALSDSRVRLTGALFSRDTRIMVSLLRALGFHLETDEPGEWIEVHGQGGVIPNSTARLHVGNAGTAARFLTAFVCLHPAGRYEFDGDEAMRARPMGGLIRALEDLGARFQFYGEQHCFPFEVRTSGIRGGRWRVDASASSQMLSALMMVAPLANEAVHIDAPNVRPAFVNMTAGIMRQWGAIIAGTPSEGYELRGSQTYAVPAGGEFPIEPDVTAASYFMMLPRVVGGSLEVLGFHRNMLQGDRAFGEVVGDIGVKFDQTPRGWRFSARENVPGHHRRYDFRTFSDTFLTLAAVAPLLPFPVTISGIGHTRHQETDRIKAMATELLRVGARVEEKEESLTIFPFDTEQEPSGEAVTVETYEDHRVAMSFATLGCFPRMGTDRPWIRIADPACCGKTFPGFFKALENLYQNSHDI